MSTFNLGRIVPKHCGVWDGSIEYENLSIVYYEANGNSYISSKTVPSGVELSDTDYWSICSEFSEQIEEAKAQILSSSSKIGILDVILPTSDWVDSGDEDYPYYCDVEALDVTDAVYPIASVQQSSLSVAYDAGLSSVVQSMSGALRFWTYQIPEEDISLSVALLNESLNSEESSSSSYVLPTATETRLGGVMIGDGISVDTYGTISTSVQLATDEEVAEMLEEISME